MSKQLPYPAGRFYNQFNLAHDLTNSYTPGRSEHAKVLRPEGKVITRLPNDPHNTVIITDTADEATAAKERYTEHLKGLMHKLKTAPKTINGPRKQKLSDKTTERIEKGVKKFFGE